MNGSGISTSLVTRGRGFSGDSEVRLLYGVSVVSRYTDPSPGLFVRVSRGRGRRLYGTRRVTKTWGSFQDSLSGCSVVAVHTGTRSVRWFSSTGPSLFVRTPDGCHPCRDSTGSLERVRRVCTFCRDTGWGHPHSNSVSSSNHGYRVWTLCRNTRWEVVRVGASDQFDDIRVQGSSSFSGYPGETTRLGVDWFVET